VTTANQSKAGPNSNSCPIRRQNRPLFEVPIPQSDQEGRLSRMFSQALLCDDKREFLAAGASMHHDGAWSRSHTLCNRLAIQFKHRRSCICPECGDWPRGKSENFCRQRDTLASNLASDTRGHVRSDQGEVAADRAQRQAGRWCTLVLLSVAKLTVADRLRSKPAATGWPMGTFLEPRQRAKSNFC
jgi:hypothetical protein